jgi:hypothetical protein
VLIFPAICQFDYKDIVYLQTQFLLYLIYTITVYKSQRLTLSQAVLNLNQEEYCSGLLYIAVLYIKTLDSLLFEIPFDYKVFTGKKSAVSQNQELDYNIRTVQLL